MRRILSALVAILSFVLSVDTNGQSVNTARVPSGRVSFDYPAEWRVIPSTDPSSSDKVMVGDLAIGHGLELSVERGPCGDDETFRERHDFHVVAAMGNTASQWRRADEAKVPINGRRSHDALFVNRALPSIQRRVITLCDEPAVIYVEIQSPASGDRLNARILGSLRFASAPRPAAPAATAPSRPGAPSAAGGSASSFDDGTVMFQPPAGWHRSGADFVSGDRQQRLRTHRRTVSSCELRQEVHLASVRDILSGESGWSADVNAPLRAGLMRGRTLHTNIYRQRGQVRILTTFCSSNAAVTFDLTGANDAALAAAQAILPTVVLKSELSLVGTWSASGTQCTFRADRRFECFANSGGALAFPLGTWSDDGIMRPVNSSQTCTATVNNDVTLTIRCSGGSFTLNRK